MSEYIENPADGIEVEIDRRVREETKVLKETVEKLGGKRDLLKQANAEIQAWPDEVRERLTSEHASRSYSKGKGDALEGNKEVRYGSMTSETAVLSMLRVLEGLRSMITVHSLSSDTRNGVRCRLREVEKILDNFEEYLRDGDCDD